MQTDHSMPKGLKEKIQPIFWDHFGIKEMPFSRTENPNYVYWSAGHKENLMSLRKAALKGQNILFTGKKGSGKTLIINSFVKLLPDEYRVVIINNTFTNLEYYLRNICKQFGITSTEKSSFELIQSLSSELEINRRLNRKSLLIVDDIQSSKQNVLLLLGKLLNLFPKGLLQFILVGTSEILTILENEELNDLSRLIDVKLNLSTLNYQEVKQYINHRFAVAGNQECSIFKEDSVDNIYDLSKGIPLNVNRACNRLLAEEFLKRAKQITFLDKDNSDSNLLKFELDTNDTSLQFLEDAKPATIELKIEGTETKPDKNEEQVKDNSHLDDETITITTPENFVLQETANHMVPSLLNNYSDKVLNDFQKILENIRLSAGEDSLNIIGIVSPIHKQGTSTIARILSLVASGLEISNENENPMICSNNATPNRILLIDTQLRAPELHKKFEITADFGLMDFLTKNISIEKCIIKIPNSNLNIITAGSCSPFNRKPHGFEKLKIALEKLRDQFDLVLMDLPPILEYGESISLCRICDGVVLTVKLDDCRVEVLKESKKILTHANVRIIGGIVNHRKFYLPQWLYRRL